VLEVGEMLRDAAVREAREETGLAVETGELLGVFDRVLREGERIRYHYVLIDFLCQRISGEPCCGTDADEVRWFSLEELEPLKLAPDTFEVIRRGFSAVNR
jgi:8-oxo-dGTP diphosphatase